MRGPLYITQLGWSSSLAPGQAGGTPRPQLIQQYAPLLRVQPVFTFRSHHCLGLTPQVFGRGEIYQLIGAPLGWCSGYRRLFSCVLTHRPASISLNGHQDFASSLYGKSNKFAVLLPSLTMDQSANLRRAIRHREVL